MSTATSTTTAPNPALVNPYLTGVHGPAGRSGPPSRTTSSSLLMTRNASYAPSLSSLALTSNNNNNSSSGNNAGPSGTSQQEHHTKLSSRLRHMFDAQKYATFSVDVTIHELGNVPQLQGEFAVKWRFRGKRPKGKESLEIQKPERVPTPKPSLPNLKLGHGVPSVHHSSSAASIRSVSTTSSAVPPITPRSSPGRPQGRKALTQPPVSPSPDRPTKRPTDPTPLKQVIAPSSTDDDEQLPTTESPAMIVDEPEEEPDLLRGSLDQPRDTSRDSSRSSGSGSGSGSDKSNGPQILIHRPSVRDRSSAMTSFRNPSLGSNISQQSSIREFPRPRTPSNYPPVRSGTTPSFQALVEPLYGNKDEDATPIRRPLSRTASMATTATSSSASGSAYTPRPHFGRTRSVSGPTNSSGALTTDQFSESRQGSTPGRPLRSHACKWDYELHHVIRIPLGKPVPPSTSTTPNGAIPYRQQPPSPALPLLGAGPHSESGLKLVIEQLPTAGAVSSAPATGADTHSLSSMVAAAHHAHHADRKDTNPSEGHKGKHVQKERTMFGVVDLDLAMFAGRGRNTRRFLLKGSRTNATIKVTVEMKWIGGEEKWTAPPMQEGHHITGVSDLVGAEPQESIRNDLFLAKTPSNSSSSSSLGLGRIQTNISATSSAYASRNVSSHNVNVGALPTHAPNYNYKSYEHHLRQPETLSTPQSSPSKSSHRSGPGDSPERAHGGSLSSTLMLNDNHDKLNTMHASGPSPLVLSLSNMNNHHRHHTHHLRRSHESRSGIHDLPPEIIIEAIFNPHPSSESGPFTYVPEEEGEEAEYMEGTEEVLEGMIDDVDGNVGSEGTEGRRGGKGHRWKRDRNKKQKEKEKDEHAEGNGNGSGNGSKLGWRSKAKARAERER